ncbi:hypothetical protein AAFF_G00147120 [Aldrovandia affinis]|uniref:Uncharacterized protein n=1 Tax=Aldrovandia affinis TaxID=143900 RepID=A0AAD7W9R6_9TELE|nr:hypothetical protein AAFF_G00147120 [Aldrovandia affinis]
MSSAGGKSEGGGRRSPGRAVGGGMRRQTCGRIGVSATGKPAGHQADLTRGKHAEPRRLPCPRYHDLACATAGKQEHPRLAPGRNKVKWRIAGTRHNLPHRANKPGPAGLRAQSAFVRSLNSVWPGTGSPNSTAPRFATTGTRGGAETASECVSARALQCTDRWALFTPPGASVTANQWRANSLVLILSA